MSRLPLILCLIALAGSAVSAVLFLRIGDTKRLLETRLADPALQTVAARIGVPAVFIEHRTPPDTIACLKSGACDLVFLPRDGRATAIGEFSNPFIISEFTMLVPPGSAIETIADADRPGVRMAARGEAWLRREAEAVARLNHPNIVQVYDQSQGGMAFIVQEYVQGAPATVRQYGGEYVARGGAIEVLEGGLPTLGVKPGVRLEVLVPAERAFIYPRWAWELVYTGSYLALSLREFERWERSLRRAVLDGRLMGLHEPFLYKLVSVVSDMMKQSYPELSQTVERVSAVIKDEESNFFGTIDAGLLESHIDKR